MGSDKKFDQKSKQKTKGVTEKIGALIFVRMGSEAETIKEMVSKGNDGSKNEPSKGKAMEGVGKGGV